MLSLTTDEFWRLTPSQYVALREATERPNREAWRRHSHLMAMIAGAVDPKGGWQPSAFDPYHVPKPKAAPDWGAMASVARAVTRSLGGKVLR